MRKESTRIGYTDVSHCMHASSSFTANVVIEGGTCPLCDAEKEIVKLRGEKDHWEGEWKKAVAMLHEKSERLKQVSAEFSDFAKADYIATMRQEVNNAVSPAANLPKIRKNCLREEMKSSTLLLCALVSNEMLLEMERISEGSMLEAVREEIERRRKEGRLP